MNELQLTRNLLVDLLGNGQPEVGARLKQRLSEEYRKLGRPPFDQKGLGFTKFSDFLEACGDILFLDRPDGPGDLTVTLRPDAPQRVAKPPKPQLAAGRHRLRNDLWQAFTNPDPHRKRFFHLPTRSVRHYLDDQTESRHRAAIDASREEHVVIPYIDGETQLGWMREYLESLDLPELERAALGRLLEGPYASKLNYSFLGALGAHANGWRGRRANLVFARATDWAREHHIPLEVLQAPVSDPGDVKLDSQRDTPPAKGAHTKVSALLDLLSEEDVSQVVYPFLLTLLLTRSQGR